jgi:sRNA-binding carbon storage regulator CsrA
MSNEEKTVYSIHGNCVKTGKQAPQKYNVNPEEPQEPTTKRGFRRRQNKQEKKN